MKRIAIWGYFGGYGGIERMVFNFYKHLDKTKVQYDFLVPHDFGKIAYEDKILEMGGRVFRILYSERESLIKARTCWLNYFKEHPEVVGIHMHTIIPYVFPLKMAKKAGVKTRIFHAHGSGVVPETKNIIFKIRNHLIKKGISKYPSKYVACGENAASLMLGDVNYTWIKNGIEISKFAFDEETRERIRKKYNWKKEDVVVGQIGHLTELKQPFFSLEMIKKAIEKNNNIKMIYVGTGMLEGSLKQKIEKYNLDNNVMMIGALPDVSEIYQAIDCLMLPSLHEGFPVVLVEAQTAGVKCLVSDTVTREVEITDLCERFSLSDQEKWISRITEFSSPKDRNKYQGVMNERGYEISSVAKEVEKLY